MDQTVYNSYGTLLTCMHKQCPDFLWMKHPSVFSTLYWASTQQEANYREK